MGKYLAVFTAALFLTTLFQCCFAASGPCDDPISLCLCHCYHIKVSLRSVKVQLPIVCGPVHSINYLCILPETVYLRVCICNLNIILYLQSDAL